MEKVEKEEIDMLFKLILEKTGYTQSNLTHNNQRTKVHIRRILFVICRELMGLTHHRIGALVNRDRASVIHSINKHFEEIEIYQDYSKLYRSIYKRFKTMYIHHTKKYVKYANGQIRSLEVSRQAINNEMHKYRGKIIKRNIQIQQIN